MKMPGFTAEVSLYETIGHYRIATNGASTTAIQQQDILPQKCKNYPGIGIVCLDREPVWDGIPEEFDQIQGIVKI